MLCSDYHLEEIENVLIKDGGFELIKRSLQRPFFIWKMLSFLSNKCYNYIINF